MTSLLLSVLARMHRAQTASEFAAARPNCWLVWEPGVWKPPTKDGETLATLSVPTPPPAVGEALALALSARSGQPGQITLGRAASCDIEINDATLSQLHLLFMEASPRVWTVRDAGSRNGSWVDQVPIAKGVPLQLKSGSRIQAAQVCLTYYDPAGLYDRLFTLTRTPSRLQL
ncbi:MAG: FHA domain-containing protein [Myxococcales bacterium]